MNGVEISEKSKEYMKVFDKYESKNWGNDFTRRFEGRVILHLYPMQDTLNDENDSLQGVVDALLFRADIYDLTTMKKYSLENKDGIELDVMPRNAKVRIFKDFSTMIIVDGGCVIAPFQSIEISYGGRYE